MSSSVVRRQKFRKSPPQPIDRHLTEIDNAGGSIYINAGIDSTCCKKRGRTIHKLTNGIVISTPQTHIVTKRIVSGSGDDLLSELSNDSSNDDRLDSINTQCCSHCGK
ncbi:unnamed protein product [Rotaria sp. Silwood1]|nr:unnamed protein product [Rotaria sp. Silwood1]CAF3436103.1 unnamed protein product [Rotaria sp. Silwood1]CAF3461287.1 unnamed protein product [Rotaria sp. Silwood1]CAF4637548.1 unnamed protein product [Rotaria sp. Silwood1]CAF4817732.1 unnamed protein product [Rotaria sp. Silwood1]